MTIGSRGEGVPIIRIAFYRLLEQVKRLKNADPSRMSPNEEALKDRGRTRSSHELFGRPSGGFRRLLTSVR
jgi:hypothetical protein